MTRTLLLLLLGLALLAGACGSDDGDDAASGDTGPAAGGVEIVDEPFSFVPTVGNSAAYFTIRNTTDTDDVLLSADSPLFETVELHDVVMEGGSAQMVEQTEGIPIAAGAEVVLQPGGLHVMLLGADQELSAGDAISIRLVFENAGEVEITSTVRERGEDDPQPMGDMGMDEGEPMEGMEATEG